MLMVFADFLTDILLTHTITTNTHTKYKVLEDWISKRFDFILSFSARIYHGGAYLPTYTQDIRVLQWHAIQKKRIYHLTTDRSVTKLKAMNS